MVTFLIPSFQLFQRRMCCSSRQVLFHLLKFMVTFIPFQPECYPNSFVEIPFLSLLTGVVSNSFLFLQHVLHILILLVLFLCLVTHFTGAFNLVHIRCILSFCCSTSQGSLLSLFWPRRTLFFLFLFRLVPKISGRDLLLVGECCDTPRPVR